MSSGKTHRIFVYGTLKRGQPNHYLIEGEEYGTAKYIGKAVTVNKWPLVVATPYHIPFMLDAEGVGKKIKGEVFEVNENMQKRLDVLENYPLLYDKENVEVIIDSSVDTKSKRNPVKRFSSSAYILRNFKEELLKLAFIEEYHNEGVYVSPKNRPKNSTTVIEYVKTDVPSNG